MTSADELLTRLMTLDIPSACSIAPNPFGFRSRHAALREARDTGTRPKDASTVAREAKTLWWTGRSRGVWAEVRDESPLSNYRLKYGAHPRT